MASGGWINDRVNLFMFPALLPFLSEDYHKYIKRGVIVVLIILSITRLAISCPLLLSTGQKYERVYIRN